MERVESAAALADEMGIPQPAVWLTEFGQPLGLDRTIRQQVDEMSALIDALEISPDVERYAYWPGLLKAGWEVPDGRYSGWQPLAFERYEWDQETLLAPGLTDVGIMYAGR
jgi:hypothetical protein